MRTCNDEDSLVVTHCHDTHYIYRSLEYLSVTLRYSGLLAYRVGVAWLAKIHKNTGTKTYNSEDSLVVTHPTTNSPACGLSTAERTGSPVFHTLWSYVVDYVSERLMES
ncbi:hypothetical protein N7534_002673 [Penicillium rubens]|nr:hypothetical protein N7534_002673 [Penicillium rubens]